MDLLISASSLGGVGGDLKRALRVQPWRGDLAIKELPFASQSCQKGAVCVIGNTLRTTMYDGNYGIHDNYL